MQYDVTKNISRLSFQISEFLVKKKQKIQEAIVRHGMAPLVLVTHGWLPPCGLALGPWGPDTDTDPADPDPRPEGEGPSPPGPTLAWLLARRGWRSWRSGMARLGEAKRGESHWRRVTHAHGTNRQGLAHSARSGVSSKTTERPGWLAGRPPIPSCPAPAHWLLLWPRPGLTLRVDPRPGPARHERTSRRVLIVLPCCWTRGD